MNFFASEIVTPPVELPIITKQVGIARAVVDEIERTILWRAIVLQERKIVIDGPLKILELEPVASIVSITRWTPTDPAEVIPADTYTFVTRDPAGTIIAPAPGMNWPEPKRAIGSFALVYTAGWTVTPESNPGAGDAVNTVPPSVRYMIEKAIEFRAGSGLGDISIGSLKLSVADSYSTDRIPPEISSIGRAWNFRPGLFAGKP